MWTLALCVALASGAPASDESKAESTHDRWTSMKDLAVEPSLVRRLEQPLRLQVGPETLELTDGWLTPVFSGHLRGQWEEDAKRWLARQDGDAVPRLPSAEERGDHSVVGWVWSGGTGTVGVRLDDRADALILANRMVLDLGGDRAAWAPIAARSAPLTASVQDVVVLGVDPVISAAFLGAHPDPYELIVWGDSDASKRAGDRAAQVLAARTAVWEELHLETGGRLAWDRIARERATLAPEGSFTLWDALTDRRYGLVAPQVGGEPDRWLAVLRDTTGAVDARREVRVASLGLSPGGGAVDGLVGGVPHPPSTAGDPTSAPLPRVRVEGIEADSVVTVTPTGDGLDLQVTVDSLLRFRAFGAPASWIDLTLPKMDRVPGSFEIVLAELQDGTPLLGRDEEDLAAAAAPKPKPKPKPTPTPDPRPGPQPEPEVPPEPPPEAGETHLRLQLPTPLAVGAELVVHLKHVDTWPLAVFGTSPVGTASVGRSSGMQGFLPSVAPSAFGAPWVFSVRVGVPAQGKLVAAVGGRTVEEGDQDGWHVVEADSEGHRAYWPSIGVGRYVTVDDPPQQGFPGVRVRAFDTHFGTIDQFAPEARRVVAFYQGYLPPYPVREIEVFEAPARYDGFVWIAPHGMVNLQVMLDTSKHVGGSIRDEPHLESAVFAHELAHQYFGHLAPPATREDFWIAESFSELFACLYVSAAFDERDCALRMKHKRDAWEGSGAPVDPASLSRAYSSSAQPRIVYDYGPYVLGEMLIRRIGQAAFFSAFDVMLREHPWEPVTTERVRSYVEVSSGRDLGGFFDQWIHGGRLPALSLEWTTRGGKVAGKVRSDLPFGTFDVPVVVTAGAAGKVVFVTLTDGEGAFEVDVGSTKVEVRLDPEGYVLARSRSVSRAR